MGKRWDYDVPSVEVWAECLRVLKPGGHLLAFAGTRTQHRMAVRIEDAGFEIRDMIAWVYGSGFPKSLDVSKAIDKRAGAEREVVSNNPTFRKMQENASNYNLQRNEFITAPATPEAKQWQGWGTALKPALEPITVARKPLIGTVAENVLQHGTGAINVDGGRVGTEERITNWSGTANYKVSDPKTGTTTATGRWPANFIHDGSEEATDLLGASARFFYCAKASKADRGENHHPTVKPTDLMRYLCRLVTPPSGIVLDPFMGSGSTGKAAMLEGFAFVGIEREAEYIDIAKARIQSAVGLL
jgi:site-specific DNA-methyltransferase (adenine-specific)